VLLRAARFAQDPLHTAVETLQLVAQDRREAEALAELRKTIQEGHYTAEDVMALVRHGRRAVTPPFSAPKG
jgi:hypothetical protein